jgi:RNA polymerase sigma-70 factor (ECF subfamily)
MERSDEALLVATRAGDAEAFGEFFARHRGLVLAYLVRRCGPEAAADLLAETFASALIAVHRGRAPRGATAAPWLLRIAHGKLVDAWRRGRVEEQARHRLSLERIAPGDDDLRTIERIGDDVEASLRALPEAQRDALRARIVEERDYDEIAREQDATEATIRQRVSRALRRLRLEIGGME